jgi:hypothetical protein
MTMTMTMVERGEMNMAEDEVNTWVHLDSQNDKDGQRMLDGGCEDA